MKGLGAAIAVAALAWSGSASAAKIYTNVDFEVFGSTPPGGYVDYDWAERLNLESAGLVGSSSPAFAGRGLTSATHVYLGSGYPFRQELVSFEVFRDAGSSATDAISFDLWTHGAGFGLYTFTLGAGAQSAIFTLKDGVMGAPPAPHPPPSFPNRYASVIINQTKVGGLQFDNILLIRSAVPEPAAWAMMIVGFGLAGSLLRGRLGERPGRRAG